MNKEAQRDSLRPEYDFSSGVRGTHHDAYSRGTDMAQAKITTRGRTTIPKSIREAANLRGGDIIAFEIEGDHVLAYKVTPGRGDYFQGLAEIFDEWTSAKDEEAWRDI